jgi:hypothetical protein
MLRKREEPSLMIDDDEFEKIFRRMIEQFFGTFGMQPGGSGIEKMNVLTMTKPLFLSWIIAR